MLSQSRHASPRYVSGSVAPVVLERVTLGAGAPDEGRREKFIQDLVYDYPDVIPMAEIEPAFAPLISVCRELPTAAGYLDNLWMTPAGGIVLGECKLVRNPQARREVIAQGLDYARAIHAWGYEDLENAVRKALNDRAASLWSLVASESSLDETAFVDAVQRRLALGRFLVLIIGDGIQEGVEALASFLQLHAGLHTGLALLDLTIWKGVGDGLVVVPRVPMRTVIIERGVVTADPSTGMKVVPPDGPAMIQVRSSAERAVTVSEPEFYDQLDQHRPRLSIRIKAFLETVREIAVEPEFRRTLFLRARLPGDDLLTLGIIDNYGKAWFSNAWGSANKLGRIAAGDSYQRAIADLVNGQVKTYQTSTPPEIVGADGKSIDVVQLLGLTDRWTSAMQSFIQSVATTA